MWVSTSPRFRETPDAEPVPSYLLPAVVMEEERSPGDVIAEKLLCCDADAVAAARLIAEDVRANTAPRACSMPGVRHCYPCAGAASSTLPQELVPCLV